MTRNVRIVVLVAADATDPALVKSTLAAAARLADHLQSRFDTIVVGSAPADAAALALQAGAARTLGAVHATLSAAAQGPQWTQAFEQAIAAAPAIADRSAETLWLLPANPLGVEVASRLAVRQGGVALGCCDVELDLGSDGASFATAGFGGRIGLRLRSSAGPLFATLRAGRAPAQTASAQRPDATLAQVTLIAALPAAMTLARRPAAEHAADPSQSDVVVTGGRGMGCAEGFELLDRLATLLGGTWAGSLPAVDAGWAPVTRQVGQSGCYVSPSLYIAVGVSGTPQHMAGVAPGTRILAINSDPDADIFRCAEVGVVADWRALLPPLLDRLADREKLHAAQS